MCSILWWILYIWEAICWNVSHFALIHALSTRGRSLCMFGALGSIWKVFQLVRANFEQFGVGPVTWGGLTALGRVSSFCSLLHSRVALLHWFRGSVLWLRGGLHMCRGALCGVVALVWWFALFAWAWFCLGCVEPLPLPKGSEICLLQVILFFAVLWLSIACWSFFYSFIFFFFFC
jgi:hypothetical protein